MWIIATGCGVRQLHQAGTQVLIVRVAGSPCDQMRRQEVDAQGFEMEVIKVTKEKRVTKARKTLRRKEVMKRRRNGT